MKILFAFDRDLTVDVNQGPVPLELIKKLSANNEVWAIGNQLLVNEANISGIDEIFKRLNIDKLEAKKRFGNDIVQPLSGTDKQKQNIKMKHIRLHCLGLLFIDTDLKIVVDDYQLNSDGWVYFNPNEFMILANSFLRL